MTLKIKKANILGVHQFLGEGGHQKSNVYGELPKKGDVDHLQRLGKK